MNVVMLPSVAGGTGHISRTAALGLVRKPYAPEDVARAVEAVAELLRGRRPASRS